MAHTITAPVPDFTGRVAGVHFADGTAETDDEGALAYFRRHGYGITTPDQGTASDNASPPSDSDPPPSDNPPDSPDAPQATPPGRPSSRRKTAKG